jgi:DNA-binding CsgD family transcriptional regulator
MAELRESAVEHVIERFFEAAALPELWPKALHELAQACGAEGAAAHSSKLLKTFGTVASEGLAELHDGFVRRWSAPALNSHRARGIELIRKGWRGALTEQDCFTPEQLAKDPFQQEFFMRSGYSSFAGIILAQGAGSTLSVSIIRRIGQGAYSRREIAFINKLSRQLQAASTLALNLSLDATQRLSDAFALAAKPVALLDREGCVAHATERFERTLGHGITLREGRLACCDVDATQALAALVDWAVRHDRSVPAPRDAVVLPRLDGLRPLVVHVVPVVGKVHDLLHLVSAIMTVTDLEAVPSGRMGAVLQQAFDLTAAEARLAVQLVTGRSLPEIAAAEKVAYETLRGHLKSVFEKTRTGRQAELVSLIASLATSP